MTAWRRGVGSSPPDVILVQETHITSDAEATALTEQWNRAWGLQDTTKATAVWSLSTERAKGVGILINPRTMGTMRQAGSMLTDRVAVVETQVGTIMNVYAPNSPNERCEFFRKVSGAVEIAGKDLILGGDFNCVQNPQRSPEPDDTTPRTLGMPNSGSAAGRLVTARCR